MKLSLNSAALKNIKNLRILVMNMQKLKGDKIVLLRVESQNCKHPTLKHCVRLLSFSVFVTSIAERKPTDIKVKLHSHL
jgi:hypothetical protein